MGRGEERLMAVACSDAVGRWQMPQCVSRDEEWERRTSLKYLRAQEKLVSSDKGLFLTQTSLECLYFGGAEGEMSSVEGGQPTTQAWQVPRLPFQASQSSTCSFLEWHRGSVVKKQYRAVEHVRRRCGGGGAFGSLPPPTHTVKRCEGSCSVDICL